LCYAGKTCKPVSPSAGNAAADYTSMQLDFYGGLNELDASVGRYVEEEEEDAFNLLTNSVCPDLTHLF
jgi:hypothetical protein